MAMFAYSDEPELVATCVHVVRTQHRSVKMLHEMHDWCYARKGDGVYTLGDRGPDPFIFVFSNPNTAFEFRLRWC
jgi:hypothetical protein